MPDSELTNTQKLAEVLHELMCHCKQDERCAWWYRRNPVLESENWETKRYMEKAQRLEKRPLNEVISFLKDLYEPALVEDYLRQIGLSVQNTS